MRKLKLESLKVESFDTTPVTPQARGTVDGHNLPRPETRDIEPCSDTYFQDCSHNCSGTCPAKCIYVFEPFTNDQTV